MRLFVRGIVIFIHRIFIGIVTLFKIKLTFFSSIVANFYGTFLIYFIFCIHFILIITGGIYLLFYASALDIRLCRSPQDELTNASPLFINQS